MPEIRNPATSGVDGKLDTCFPDCIGMTTLRRLTGEIYSVNTRALSED